MLRYFTLITSLLCFNYTFSQISENFADGDFTSAPSWTLNSTTDFTVNAGQLKSANTTTPGNFYISTSNTLAANCQWEFWTNLQFATSSTNYVDIYLTSDVSNLQATNINGYFVRLGGTLDEICLYKRSGAIGTAVKIIDGVDAIISSSSSNLIKIKVIRNASNLFSLERDMTGTGSSYVSEGTITDATFTTSNSFGFFIQQSTGSFVGKHVFDDIVVGPIILDITPPSIVSAASTSSTSVDVFFNENVDLITSQTVSNYTITPSIGTPASATRDVVNFKLVHLTTTPSLVSGITYTIAINNVQDLAGNAISTSATSFLYIAFGTPNFKDIVINEIFADPSPVVNLTSCEFIELYNRSASPFNLSGLKFTDNTSLSTLGSYTLAPNGYVIICPIADTAQFTALGYMNKLGVSSFASLTNSGKNLYLKTVLGAFIDSVNYSDTWYKNAFKKDGGYTLEQINPNINPSCAQINNWIASNDVDGGTPGFINSVYSIAPDVTGPKISGITVIDSTHISICFNDLISVSQLTISSNYSINGSIGSPTLSVVGSGNTCVTLSLATKLINATNYTITITGITDCASNSLSPNKGLISFYKHKAFDVVINELMPDPDPAINLPTEEYVELRNRTPFKINLKNWTISTPTSTKKIPNLTIEPDSFVVLTAAGNFNAFDNYGVFVYEVTSFPSLLNDGTTLTIRDSNSVVINSINYLSSWYNDVNKKDGGWSMEQIDANNPCGGQSNWHASTNPNGGTPGRRNSVISSNTDNTSPILERIAVLSADTIMLFFNESLDSLSLQNPASYTFDNGLTAPTYILPISADFKKVKLKLSSSLVGSTIYNCTVTGNIKDCVGNLISTGSSALFGLPLPALPNDVVINEVLFDPTTTGIDFVELYNRSNKIIDLKDLRIGSMDTLTSILTYTEKITEDGYLLFPETYIVLSENGTTVKREYQTINPKGFYDIVDLPSMNIDDDVVTLSDKNSIVIDNLIYTSKMHFPLLVSSKGVSLERIDFNRPTSDKTNWNSASEAVGFATPAYKNSQYLLADGGSGVSITNPLFSPDNDGYYDVLNINYKLDEIGKIANIYIYDSKGRQVRYLIRNQQLQQEGTVSWNGINDDNEKAPIGIYVVYIELFNLSGKLNKYKLSCTLAGKL
jgi:hypothetical protein